MVWAPGQDPPGRPPLEEFQVQLGGDPEHTGGITYLCWSGNSLDPPGGADEQSWREGGLGFTAQPDETRGRGRMMAL